MVGAKMFKHMGMYGLALGLMGCPDVDQYAKADPAPDAAMSTIDSGQAVDRDQFVQPEVDQGQVTDAGLGSMDASLVDEGVSQDASFVGQDMANMGDSGIPSECTVTFEVSVPGATPEDVLYLAGEGFDAPEWEPSVESLAMTRQGNRASLSVIRPHLARLEYKYTRGSWDTVEGTLDCGNIDDRALIVDCFNGQITVQDEVLNWVDLCDP